MKKRMEVGFIGLGHAGASMATNLLRAGHTMNLYDIRREAMDHLAAKGAQPLSDPKNVAESSEIVFCSLPHPKISRHVFLGKDGLVEGLQRGSILVETSTISPTLACEVAEHVRGAGGEFIDAGIAGGLQRAREGKLVIMVGGAERAVKQVWPLFQVLGEHIFHLGDVGMGMTAKVINNQMSHVIMVAIAEGFAMAVEKGLDPRVLYKAISLSSGNSHQLHDRFHGRILPRNFTAGMKVDLAYKDSELALDLGRETQTPLFVTSAAHTVYELARTKGLGEFDYAAIVRLWEEWMGINMSGGE